ncbi:MAG TPA: DUF6152 family protein [Terriglobia bacterium]|nr:DUF6152 family protein [Terriglobia bacterium]
MKKMMMAGRMGGLISLLMSGLLMAHHSLVQFDTTSPVWVKGRVVLFDRVNPHTLLVLDEKRSDGQSRRWVVEGPAAFQLSRLGIVRYDKIRIGDIVEACGYVPKPGVESQRVVSKETISSNLKDVSGYRMDGELLVLPDGQKTKWSDYRAHKCLPADYKDLHTR